jgi:hypothetical protein
MVKMNCGGIASRLMGVPSDIDVDSEPIELSPELAPGLLPDWYMPAVAGGVRPLRGWRRLVVIVIVASFVVINAYGLCSTYGSVGFG